MIDRNKVAEIEDLAFRGAELPDGLQYPDELLFLKLRYLYAYAQMIQMSPEQGKKEKNKILDAYRVDSFMNEQLNAAVRLWKNVELVTAEIRKSELKDQPLIRELLERIYKSKMGSDLFELQ